MQKSAPAYGSFGDHLDSKELSQMEEMGLSRSDIRTQNGKVFNLSTYSPSKLNNDQSNHTSIQEQGIDSLSDFGSGGAIPGPAGADGAGGGGADGFFFFFTDGTTQFISTATATADRDVGTDPTHEDWGIIFTLGDGQIIDTGTASTYGVVTALYDDIGYDQTKVYLPIYLGGNLVTAGGVYLECVMAALTDVFNAATSDRVTVFNKVG